MFYIIGSRNSVHGEGYSMVYNTVYKVLDNNTNSILYIGEKRLIDLCNTINTKIVNASIIKNRVVLSDWTKVVYTGDKKDVKYFDFAVVSKISTNEYKIIDKRGKVRYVNLKDIIDLILCSSICNCVVINKDGNQKIRFTDCINDIPEYSFKEKVDIALANYIAKVKLISGTSIELNYKIEGRRVVLLKFKSNKGIDKIPEGITSLTKNCIDIPVEYDIIMPNSVEHVGALMARNINKVYLGNSVEYYIDTIENKLDVINTKGAIRIY